MAGEDTDEGYIPNEDFGYIAQEAYETMTSCEMPATDVAFPSDPAGDDWDFDDEELCQQKLPKLTEKFGG